MLRVELERMAARLGILPWEAGRLTPTEIRALYDGWRWRHSRGIEMVAVQTTWIRSMLGEVSLDQVLGSFPYYDHPDKD